MIQQITPDLRPEPIRLSPIELRPHRLLNDGEEFDSIEALAHHLAVQCISTLIDVVRHRNPLEEPEYSSIIWLRPNGRIELVREKHYRDRSYEDLLSESVYVETFRSKSDALPTSRFHRCIKDQHGEVLRDLKGRAFFVRRQPTSDNSIVTGDAYAAAVSRLSLEKMRIETLDQLEALKVIKRCRYREALKRRILAWLILGKYPGCLERLSAFGLRRVSEQNAVVEAFGKERFTRVLAEKTRQALIEDAVA